MAQMVSERTHDLVEEINKPLTVEDFTITMNTNQSIGHSYITTFAFFGITKKRIRYPNAINEGIVQSNLR